ncbi:hypothetical protein KJS94_01380 [Flavihumibacter rivuli]|uniref:FAD-binding domain-containing protein n=1 Tax=Flavihumibacter rivuli TaxID=2838156 RepID=UPI001BDE7000|nr:FAD-binding domain-containing protein [Flavihumibacter rivuli]ULQ56847.1 hypothetical protein KJS94_01380 [Flavihumibacter rivuli]
MKAITFPTQYNEILERINSVDPIAYAKTRNYIDGKVTYLSPYLSRGVITLAEVKDAVLAKGYKPWQIGKFLQELAWREYFQQVWWHLGDKMFTDIKRQQEEVDHYNLPTAIQNAGTGIDAIDKGIEHLYSTGYMHNHLRMYVAGITCNIGKAHWSAPAAWMYYHLLDGDLASNTCSWQWVAGSFSSKKYIANQENINRYLNSRQTNSFLDHPYEAIFDQPVPDTLNTTHPLELQTTLPASDSLNIDPAKPVLLYNSYQLNPNWRKDEAANRILLLEPSHFNRFPVSEKVMAFIMELARQNIPGIQVAVMEARELRERFPTANMYSINHPIARHYPGQKDPYPWMFPEVSGYFPSFFAYWKKAERHI